jgi:hypothetical protein
MTDHLRTYKIRGGFTLSRSRKNSRGLNVHSRVRVGWPSGILKSNEYGLCINSCFVKKQEFNPGDIQEIRVYRYIPFLMQGIIILHNRTDLYDLIDFSTFTNPHTVLRRIKESGFKITN